MMDKNKQNQRGVKSVTCPEEVTDLDRYGIDPDVTNDSESENTVALDDVDIGSSLDAIFQKLTEEFNCIENDENYGINTFQAVKTRVEELLK